MIEHPYVLAPELRRSALNPESPVQLSAADELLVRRLGFAPSNADWLHPAGVAVVAVVPNAWVFAKIGSWGVCLEDPRLLIAIEHAAYRLELAAQAAERSAFSLIGSFSQRRCSQVFQLLRAAHMEIKQGAEWSIWWPTGTMSGLDLDDLVPKAARVAADWYLEQAAKARALITACTDARRFTNAG
jgi:hypothetical protein